MIWFVLLHLVLFVVDLVTVTQYTDRDKDVAILLLRQQLRRRQRERPRPPRLTRGEQLTLAVLTAKLTHLSAGPRARLDQVHLLFKPETVLTWHGDLVRRTGTIRRPQTGGRPAIAAEVETLVLCLAREPARWGYRRIQGELAKLGHLLSHTTVRALLQRHGLLPAPEQQRRGSTWWQVLARCKCGRGALDPVGAPGMPRPPPDRQRGSSAPRARRLRRLRQ